MFINLCQFHWQVKSTDTFDHLFFGESLKLENVWDCSVNIMFNVFYSTFTSVFYCCHVFTFFNVFFILILTFFYIYGLSKACPELMSALGLKSLRQKLTFLLWWTGILQNKINIAYKPDEKREKQSCGLIWHYLYYLLTSRINQNCRSLEL